MSGENNNNKKKAILISNVFVGSYGYNKENLPHEVINFFMADDGGFYYYVPPYGLYNKQDYQIERIVFVRNIGNGILEILAQAEGLKSYFDDAEYTKDKTTKLGDELEKAQKTVKYGGKSIEEIYAHEGKDWHIFMSGKADTIRIPSVSMFITTHEKLAVGGITYLLLNSDKAENKPAKLNNQSMLYYVTEENEEAYKTLDKLCEQGPFEQIDKYDPTTIADDHSFIKILRQQDAEVSFSNMLFWFVSEYETVRNCFVEKVLGLNNFFDNGNTVIVEREKNRMDLSIRIVGKDNTTEKIIIVENKIKSGINGASTRKTNKEEDEAGIVNNSNDLSYKSKYENGTLKRISQLSKYYEIARNKYNVPADSIYTFILAPEYYKQVIESEKSKYLYGDKYTIISYKKLWDIFKAEDFSKAITGKEEIRFNDFITSLEKHTKVVDDEFRNEMMIRLRNRIEQKK